MKTRFIFKRFSFFALSFNMQSVCIRIFVSARWATSVGKGSCTPFSDFIVVGPRQTGGYPKELEILSLSETGIYIKYVMFIPCRIFYSLRISYWVCTGPIQKEQHNFPLQSHPLLTHHQCPKASLGSVPFLQQTLTSATHKPRFFPASSSPGFRSEL